MNEKMPSRLDEIVEKVDGVEEELFKRNKESRKEFIDGINIAAKQMTILELKGMLISAYDHGYEDGIFDFSDACVNQSKGEQK